MISGKIEKSVYPVIKISDRWSLRGDRYQWTLTKSSATQHPFTKEETIQKTETYHGTLRQVAKKILNEDLKLCDSIEGILKLLGSTTNRLEEALIMQVGESNV